MQYLAHYRSPNASAARAAGVFEFESDARVGTKAVLQDARMAMLELYGKEAVAWIIESVERRKKSTKVVSGQLTLDFRDPVQERKRPKKKEYW